MSCAAVTANPKGQLANAEYCHLRTSHARIQKRAEACAGETCIGKSNAGETCTGRSHAIKETRIQYESRKNETNSIHPSHPSGKARAGPRRARVEYQIEYDALLEDPRVSAAQLDEIVSLMTETLCSGKETISVGGEEHPAGTVKEQLKRLTSEHIEYVLLCMRRTTGPIRNIRRYLLTALYNAPMTQESFNQAEVNRQLRRQVVSACGSRFGWMDRWIEY